MAVLLNCRLPYAGLPADSRAPCFASRATQLGAVEATAPDSPGSSGAGSAAFGSFAPVSEGLAKGRLSGTYMQNL